AGGHPFGRSRAAAGRRPVRPRRRCRALRGARLRGRDPRTAPRARPDAGAAERGRPAALPRLSTDTVSRSGRLPCAAGALFLMVESTVVRARRFELSAAQFLNAALASVAALWLIVVTGAAVRLTDSGLGCRPWPGCDRG